MDNRPHGLQDKDKEKEEEEETEAKPKQPMGNRPAREESLRRAPWNSKTVAKKIITEEPAPSKPVVLDVEESNQSCSNSTSSKNEKM